MFLSHFRFQKLINVKMQLKQIISWLLLGVVIPCIVSAPVHSSDIVSTIKGIHKNLDGNGKSVTENDTQLSEEEAPENDEGDQIQGRPVLMPEMSQMRQNKMFGFYGYLPAFAPIPAYYPTLPPPDYFSDYSYYGYNDEDEDVMSRGAGTKKRPGGGQFKNSPIYYIRLPPTPYMFVPGVGYISQPPTYQPMTPIMPPVVPAIPAMQGPASPFYNLPLNFMANGKPTNIYQWQGNPQLPPSAMPGNQYGMQMPNQFAMQSPSQFGMPQPSYGPQVGPQQMPSPPQQAQRPHKPYRPYPRPPQNTYMQDSKVTHLKGPYLFNGRPEDIYLLSNFQNLQNPYNAGYYPDPYSYNNYNPYNSYY